MQKIHNEQNTRILYKDSISIDNSSFLPLAPVWLTAVP